MDYLPHRLMCFSVLCHSHDMYRSSVIFGNCCMECFTKTPDTIC
ncbi:hypothetical protein Plhal304r1_c096g0173591 [Plasmopara halstedii]